MLDLNYDIYLLDVVSEYREAIKQTKSKEQQYCFTIFYFYCKKYYTTLSLYDFDSEILERFLVIYIPENSYKLSNIAFFDCLKDFCQFMAGKYDFHNATEIWNGIWGTMKKDIERITAILKEFSIFLCEPVVSYKPLIIDFELYKKRKNRTAYKTAFDVSEVGYFEVVEFFTNNSIVVRKMFSGRHIKINLNTNLISQITIGDIFFAQLRQKPFLTWEIEELKGFYCAKVARYI